MRYIAADSKIMWDNKTHIVKSYHVSTACREVSRVGYIFPAGVTKRSALGGNTNQPYMISSYAKEELAENLIFFFAANILLGARTLTGPELKKFAKKQIEKIKPDLAIPHEKPKFEDKDTQALDDLNSGVDAYYKALSMPLFTREALEYTSKSISYLYNAAWAIDPIMLTSNWMEPFVNDPYNALDNICAYEIQYEAKYFIDYGGLFGPSHAVKALHSIYECELVDSGWFDFQTHYMFESEDTRDYETGEQTDAFIGQLIAKQYYTATKVSEAVHMDIPFKIRMNTADLLHSLDEDFATQTFPYFQLAQNIPVNLMPSSKETLKFVIMEELDGYEHLSGMRFVLEGDLEADKIVMLNAPECEIRYFTKGIPLKKNTDSARTFAVKTKTARDVLDIVAKRYEAQGYRFKEKEFPLFWIPE